MPVDLRVVDAPAVEGRGRAVVEHEREGLAAVGRLVQADLRRVRVEHRAAAVPRDAADAERRRDVESAGAVDHDRCDRVAGADRRAAGDEHPARAAVVRLVEPDTRLGVAGGVRLAGAGVEHVVRGVVRERADRVRAEPARDELPRGRRRECVVGAPDAAAGRGDPHAAVARAAGRRDRHRRDAAGGDVVGVAAVEDGRVGRRRRPGQLPAGAALCRAAAAHRREGARGGPAEAGGEGRARVGPVGDLFSREAALTASRALPADAAWHREALETAAIRVARQLGRLRPVQRRVGDSGHDRQQDGGGGDESQCERGPAVPPKHEPLSSLLGGGEHRPLETLLQAMHDLAVQAPPRFLGRGRKPNP